LLGRSNQILLKPEDRDTHECIAVRKRLLQTARQCGTPGARDGNGHPVGHTGDGPHAEAPTAALGHVELHRDPYLNPRNERSLEALGHDPDDRVRELVERHRPPQCPHRAAEALLPERVAEQNHPLPARNVFLG
jgi:hypothetical protein